MLYLEEIFFLFFFFYYIYEYNPLVKVLTMNNNVTGSSYVISLLSNL